MVTTRKKAANKTALKPLQLTNWLAQVKNLSDEEFIQQFQDIALSGDYNSVQCLFPFVPDAYYEDGCERAHEVLSAGHDDIFVLLTRTSTFHDNDPGREKKKALMMSALAFLAVLVLAMYSVFIHKAEL